MPNETSTQVQIGPGAIADPGTPNGRPFLMSRTEWITVQTYVIDVLALPITADAFRKSLGSGAPSDLSDFTPLISAYSSMHDHCEIWQNETFPATVTLATDIANYGTTKAPVYYPPILKEADILTNDPNNAQASRRSQRFLTICRNRQRITRRKPRRWLRPSRLSPIRLRPIEWSLSAPTGKAA